MKISLLTGGGDRPYALGLLTCLVSRDIYVDFIGSDELFEKNLMKHPKVVFHNLRGDQNPNTSPVGKAIRVAQYYVRLFKYAYQTDSLLLHILWLNKFIYFDRTVMNCYYKLLGKKIVHTAHNIDQQERDGKSTVLNRATLSIMYKLMDHIFVHTNKMKLQLIDQYNIEENKISVIPFGVNNTVPDTNLTRDKARVNLGLNSSDKVILFFGNIAPYKGLEYLVKAISILKEIIPQLKVIIAGRVKNSNSYWDLIQDMIKQNKLEEFFLIKTEFIPDEEVEIYFKAADILVLPYKKIFQSGVLFLSYNFGLPVIASDVGSLRDYIVGGETGFLCSPEDPESLASSILTYFSSYLYSNIDRNSKKIKDFARETYSWDEIGNITKEVYHNTILYHVD